jgi:hypothetical protein
MKPSRNLWPWGILLAFGLFFTGTIGLVVVACSHRMDLVSADYYEREIKYEGQLDRLRRAGSQASIVYNAPAQRLQIGLPLSPGAPLSGFIELYRPSSAALDCRYPLSLDAGGVHTLDVRNLSPGLWKVRVSWNATGQEFFAEKSVILGPS